MEITSAKYIKDPLGIIEGNRSIKATIDGTEYFVPLDPLNSEYAEIMRQVDAGELTIAPADEEE